MLLSKAHRPRRHDPDRRAAASPACASSPEAPLVNGLVVIGLGSKKVQMFSGRHLHLYPEKRKLSACAG